MIRRPPRSTQSRSSAASDVYKRQESLLDEHHAPQLQPCMPFRLRPPGALIAEFYGDGAVPQTFELVTIEGEEVVSLQAATVTVVVQDRVPQIEAVRVVSV